MGRARYEDLRDLEDLLWAIRRLPEISEPKPGIFYLRRSPFLHFHTKDGSRWADVKVGATWGPELPIPFNCGRRERSVFLRETRARYEACSERSERKSVPARSTSR